ncbi:MAG TPA: carboxylesterase family protein [Polyangiales bacterium]|nr:carboxylesterase family protein [Polyangiales bacterium]
MTNSDGKGGEISRRALLHAATAALAVAPVIAACSDDSDTSSDEMGADKEKDASAGTTESCVTTDRTVSKDTTESRDTGTTETEELNTSSRPESRRALFFTTETTSGRVMGLGNGDVKQFKGIPYGAPTGGKNRFMPPQPPASWKGTRETFKYGMVAPQLLNSLDSEYGRLIYWDLHPGGYGEDCLVLNVWTTSLDRNAKKAVLVSFHGGGFASGSGNTLGFDGAMMAHTQDVVVVTINHRLNAFGYLNLKDLDAPDEFKYAGVAGIMDMAASLEWVRDNIENFGGDPGRVMIFGQSGGGAKTSTMLSNAKAKGLFHSAAVQSGSALKLMDSAQAATNAEILLKELGISKNDIPSIQKKSWQEILEASVSLMPPMGATSVGFSPVVDGDYLTRHPFDPDAPGESADVPVIISSTLHDSALALTNFDLDDAGLEKVIAGRFGEDRAKDIVKAQKQARPQDSNYLIQAAAFTDASRGSATYVQAERKAALKKAPVYVYQWDWISQMADGKFGAIHGLDVSPAFNNWRDATISNGSAKGKRVCEAFAKAWAAFAKTGDPNISDSGLPEWPAFSAEKRSIMVFDDDLRVENDYRGELIRQLAPKT